MTQDNKSEDIFTSLLNDSREWEKESTEGAGWSTKFKMTKQEVAEMVNHWKQTAKEHLKNAKLMINTDSKVTRSTKELALPESLPDPESVEEEVKTKAKLELIALVLKRLQAVVRDHATLMEFLRELFLKQSKEKEVLEKKIEETEKKVDNSKIKVEDVENQTKANAKVVSAFSKKLDEQKAELVVNTDTVKSNDFKVEALEVRMKKLEDENVKLNEEKVEIAKANVELEKDVDETRQRGLKGNIILSSPNSQNKPTLLIHETKPDTGGRETDLEMCLRLIKSKTTVDLKKEDVVACHRLGDTDRTKFSYVIRINNRNNGTAWDTLANGMVTGKLGTGEAGINFDRNLNVYLNFQLTRKRMAISHQCRLLLKDKENKPIGKYSVNQNGKITVRKVSGQGKWLEVKDMEALAKIAGRPLPIQQGQT